MPNTTNVIYAWDKKILSFSKNSKFYKQAIYKNDHIIDIDVDHRAGDTLGDRKRPPAVASTQWCK